LNPIYYQIAVQSPLRRLFDYLPPLGGQQELAVGVRVKVPFGHRTVVGLVLGSRQHSDVPVHKLKPIAEVLDSKPLIPRTLFQLFQWASRYYQHPQGDALLSTFPVLLRKGEPLPKRMEPWWRLSVLGQGLPEGGLRRARAQQQLLTLLQKTTSVNRQQLDEAGIKRATLSAMLKKKLVEEFDVAPKPITTSPENLLGEQPLTLYGDQQKVLSGIEMHGYHGYLLEGETGCGKTEIYLQAIEKILRYGRQALVLIPEISLTPQMVKRFKKRFNCPLAVMHSGLTDKERLVAWDMARTGEAPVVIGTRSTIFTPLKSPGIIIVDEEHDQSFKQHQGFRYNARDLAVIRANRENIPVVLGSATPALESLSNAEQGRYTKLSLRGRPGNATLPTWQLEDVRKQNMTAGFSTRLLDAMEVELNQGNQVLVFLNRRGFSPTLMCHDCGWIAECHRCDVRMTVHLSERKLVCHHCEHQHGIPPKCPTCFSKELQYLGQGTERGEVVLKSLFPEFSVIRVDRDTTRRKNSMHEVMQEVSRGEPCILLGTQLLAKGHHFPDVTLVAILDADAGLFSADFRAPEKMGQMITQVAGRSGRGDKPGRVILQSHHCDHPLIQILSQQGYRPFARALAAERRMAQMPPYSYMAVFKVEGHRRHEIEDFLSQARHCAEQLLPANPDCSYLGPYPAPMGKRSGRYRYQFILTFVERAQLQGLLGVLVARVEQMPLAKKVRWSIDVDPQDLT
jgi:primosomal protein N' (replication factor Y)